MLRVQNPTKQAVSLALSLAVVVAMGDLQVARSHDQNKIHIPPHRLQVPHGSMSLNGVHKLKQEQ
jgi:acyl CoA:acetate/3-ketoacid CoA transferase beta subunit